MLNLRIYLSKDRHGHSPLSYPAEEGHEAVVKILVARDDLRWTRMAVLRYPPPPYMGVMRWRDDVEANTKDYHGGSPLLVGHEAAVKILVTPNDVEVDSKDDAGCSPLLRRPIWK